ncbi:MAG: hypothetical protein IJX65_08315, partial [Alistipes sp.]|nr:hypothetical protein [Alistipes sp.]
SYTVGDVTSVAACKEMGVVIFDFDITIDYHAMTSALYNITRVGCYQVTDVSDFHREYRYTFTDEDYQYALEHGTKLELGE